MTDFCINIHKLVLYIYKNNAYFYNPLTRMCRNYNKLLTPNLDVLLISIFDDNIDRYRHNIQNHASSLTFVFIATDFLKLYRQKRMLTFYNMFMI